MAKALPDEHANSAEHRTSEDKIVDAEFSGMDNDLIDMGSFGMPGTGVGTQTGGAGERLRPMLEEADVDETSAGGLQYPHEAPGKNGASDR